MLQRMQEENELSLVKLEKLLKQKFDEDIKKGTNVIFLLGTGK